jgi:hypothetical protein
MSTSLSTTATSRINEPSIYRASSHSLLIGPSLLWPVPTAKRSGNVWEPLQRDREGKIYVFCTRSGIYQFAVYRTCLKLYSPVRKTERERYVFCTRSGIYQFAVCRTCLKLYSPVRETEMYVFCTRSGIYQFPVCRTCLKIYSPARKTERERYVFCTRSGIYQFPVSRTCLKLYSPVISSACFIYCMLWMKKNKKLSWFANRQKIRLLPENTTMDIQTEARQAVAL